MMDFVLFHDNCQDGWAAAYIAKKRYPTATLVPMIYGLTQVAIDQLMSDLFHKDVLIVDYSFAKREINEELANVTKSLLILDHHASKKANLEGCSYAVFDNVRSGAGLAWDYLFGRDAKQHLTKEGNGLFSYPLPQERPWWVNYTEDQDLWLWQLPYSREINSYLMVQPRTLSGWAQIEAQNVRYANAAGIHILARTNFEVEQAIRTRMEVNWQFEDKMYRTAIVNSSAVVSEAGEYLVNELSYDIALFWHYSGADRLMHFGLRSKHPMKGGIVNVGQIAKHFGGGGHFSSSGFEHPFAEGRKILDEIVKQPIEVPQRGPFNRCS